MHQEMTALFGELQRLTEGLRGFGSVEAAMRLRALCEIAEALGTDALLDWTGSLKTPEGEADETAQAA